MHTYTAEPAMTIDTSKLYQATIVTPKGDIVLCLQPNLAPNTVNVMVTLMRNKYYNGIPFHRVVARFVVQGGDPECIGHVPAAPATPSGTCGDGGPGFQFADEPVHQQYVEGAVAMANSGAEHQRLAVLHLHRRRLLAADAVVQPVRQGGVRDGRCACDRAG